MMSRIYIDIYVHWDTEKRMRDGIKKNMRQNIRIYVHNLIDLGFELFQR